MYGENEQKIALFVAAGGLDIPAFEQADAKEAADIRAHLRRLSSPIGPYDVLIAGQTRRAAATLATANGREFERCRGCRYRSNGIGDSDAPRCELRNDECDESESGTDETEAMRTRRSCRSRAQTCRWPISRGDGP